MLTMLVLHLYLLILKSDVRLHCPSFIEWAFTWLGSLWVLTISHTLVALQGHGVVRMARVGSQVGQSHSSLSDFTVDIICDVGTVRSHACLVSIGFSYIIKKKVTKLYLETYIPFGHVLGQCLRTLTFFSDQELSKRFLALRFLGNVA